MSDSNFAQSGPDRTTVLLAEYSAAQEMLRHYDTLNWQIGAILVAGTSVMTGFLLQEKVIDLIRVPFATSSKSIIPLAIPIITGLILQIWVRWFDRHRNLYNLRNEVMHRIELQLGMYHHLRVLEASKGDSGASLTAEHAKARDAVRQFFAPQVDTGKSLGTPGHLLAHYVALLIPVAQTILYLVIKGTT